MTQRPNKNDRNNTPPNDKKYIADQVPWHMSGPLITGDDTPIQFTAIMASHIFWGEHGDEESSDWANAEPGARPEQERDGDHPVPAPEVFAERTQHDAKAHPE
jgi:hypothetical protein